MGFLVRLLFVLLASSSWGHGLNEEDFQNLLSKVEILTTSNEELRSSYADLSASNEDLMSRQDILEDRVSKLEELAKVGTLRTCAEYAQYGLKTSGLYMVDPDGPLLGQPPFQVFCNFDAGKNIFVLRLALILIQIHSPGTTEVMHNVENMTLVDHCHEPGKI